MVRSKKSRVVAALVIGAAVTPALVPAPAAPRSSCRSTANVRIADSNGGDKLFFSKRKVTIRQGGCVRWTWAGMLEHQVRGPGFKSKARSAPFSYRKRFASSRRTPALIVCGIHPSMRMRVAVRR